jgi:hypothetical protein
VQCRGELFNRHETAAETMPGGLAARRRRRGLTAAPWPAMAVGALVTIDGPGRLGAHFCGGLGNRRERLGPASADS